MKRLIGGVLIGLLLAQVPAAAFTRKDFYDAARRWEQGWVCQGLYRHGLETASFFIGC